MMIIINLILLIVFTVIFVRVAEYIIDHEDQKDTDRMLDELIREYSHKEDKDEKNF